MKTAIDIYKPGKMKEVSADDYSFVCRDSQRFMCPLCFEYVSMVDGKLSKFFRHRKQTAETKECERRSTQDSDRPIYERLGMPVFIRKEMGSFKIMIGFRPIPKRIIDESKKQNGFIEIANYSTKKKQKYFINETNFSTENVIYKELDSIAGTTLSIIYSSEKIQNMLQPYWSNFIDISWLKKGAFFQNGSNGGKIIRQGDSISTYKNYLFLVPSHSIMFSFSNENFKKVGTTCISFQNYDIYKGMFKVDTSNAEFKNISNYLLSFYKIFLIDEDTNIIPIWPPCVKTEIGYRMEKERNIYYSIISNNDIPKQFVFDEYSAIPSIFETNEYNGYFFGKFKVDTAARLINIDRKLTARGNIIYPTGIKQKNDAFYLNKNKSVDIYMFEKIEDIKLTLSAKTEVYLIDFKNRIIKNIFPEGKVSFEPNSQINEFYILCNNVLVAVGIKNQSKLASKKICKSDFKDIYRLQGQSVEVTINAQIMRNINEIIKDDQELAKVFQPFISKKKIPLSFVKYILGGIKHV